MGLSNCIGPPVSRLGADQIAVNGTHFQVVVSCTLIDAFCGMIPLLWDLSVSAMSNVLGLMTLFAVISAFNIVRLQAGFVAYAHGVPWGLAHEVVSGLTYFMLLVFVVIRQSRQPRASARQQDPMAGNHLADWRI